MLAGTGTAAAVAPAQAGAPAAAAAVTDQPPPIRTAAAQAARDRVLKMAMSNLPAEIRSSAWLALRSSRGDEAIEEWFAPGGGFDAAMRRGKETKSLNRAFCERVAGTHTAEFSPAVHAAAERALMGSDADRAAFVKSGYAEAQKRDRAAREAGAQYRQEVVAKDRDFVRKIAEHDPGEQVRVAAQWALRPAATDADVEEFFGYGWAAGASLDLEAHRLQVAEAEAVRHRTLALLIEKAVAAEEALKGSTDAAKARAEAEEAWKSVAGHADAARRAWLAEQEAAAAQAENWARIAKAAKEDADGLWKHIAGSVETNQDSWAKEQADAADTATFWKDMFDRAQDSENRVKG
ncbi:hypothetical protein AB0A70_16445 [Streptomyces morookaense]|uniref:hypothetical protein n=1 Tax=Streptomyces morookaense TaxID=1970 RepID=UPI0033E0F396